MSARDIASELAKNLGSAGVGDAAGKALDALAREDATALATIAGTAMGGPALGLALLLGGIVLQSIGKRKDKKTLKADFDRVLAEVLSARNDVNRLDDLLRPMVERTNFLNQHPPSHEKADIARMVADKVKLELAPLLPENADAIDFDSIRIYLETNTSLLREIKSSLSDIHDKLDGLRDLYTSGQIATPTIPKGVRDNFAIAGISRNASFVGRTSTLSQLHAAITDASATTPAVVLSAEGGVGKSEIAKAYVFHDEYSQNWDGVWWLDASAVAIDGSLEQLLDRLGRPSKPGENLPVMRAALANRLGTGRHLLVLDNVEDLTTLSDFVLPKGCWKLATTRLPPDHIPPQQGVTLRIDVLNDDEAAALLLERRDDLCKSKQPGELRSPLSEHAEAARALAEHLGNHALAIAFAAAALGQQPRPSLPKLLERLKAAEVDARGHAFERLKAGDIGTSYRHKVAEALLLLLPGIEAEHPVAVPIMVVVSLCHNEKIPLSVVAGCLKSDTDSFESALHALHAASVVQIQEPSRDNGPHLLEVHVLTQSAVRARCSDDRLKETAAALVDELNTVYIRPDIPKRWPDQREAYPHAARWMDREFEDAESLARLLNNVAGWLDAAGRVADAEPLARRALALCKAAYVHDHPLHATVLNNLAGHCKSLEKYEDSMLYCTQAYDMRKRMFGLAHPDTAQSIHNMASNYEIAGRDELAEEAYTLGIKVFREVGTRTTVLAAMTLSNLAGIYRSQERLQDSLVLYEQAEQMLHLRYRSAHPYLAKIFNNVGGIYQLLGKYPEAANKYQQSLDMRLVLYEDDHPDLAESHHNVGVMHAVLERWQEAVRNLELCVEMARRCPSISPSDRAAYERALVNVRREMPGS